MDKQQLQNVQVKCMEGNFLHIRKKNPKHNSINYDKKVMVDIKSHNDVSQKGFRFEPGVELR